jgi:hypothetical protein
MDEIVALLEAGFNAAAQPAPQAIGCSGLLTLRSRDKRKYLRMADGLNRQINIKLGPIQMVLARPLNVH